MILLVAYRNASFCCFAVSLLILSSMSIEFPGASGRSLLACRPPTDHRDEHTTVDIDRVIMNGQVLHEGTGFLLASGGEGAHRPIIVTSRHVIMPTDNTDHVRVIFADGTTFGAGQVWMRYEDDRSEVALLSVATTPPSAKELEPGNYELLKKCDGLVVMGYTMEHFHGISALSAEVTWKRPRPPAGWNPSPLFERLPRFDPNELLDYSIRTGKGMSGGPVLDSDGKVIGVMIFRFPEIGSAAVPIPVVANALKLMATRPARKYEDYFRSLLPQRFNTSKDGGGARSF